MNSGFRVGVRSAPRDAHIPNISLGEGSRRETDGALNAELNSLARESDPEIFFEGILAAAARQESSGRQDLAVELYAGMLREAEDGGAVASASLRRRAQERLDAILGRGAWGPRAEYLLRNFAQQASDPSMIFAMGAAGAVFRMTRLAVLSRLTVGPQTGVLTQLLGAGRLASLAGFALEAPAFTVAARLGSAALGRPLELNGGSWGRDLASSYLVLGGLRMAGWGAGAVGNRLAGSNGAGNGAVRGLLQQGGMLTGIMLGHRLEEELGLRAHREGATVLLDSLATLLQFNVAGRLSHQAFGSQWSAWERSLDLQSEILVRSPRRVVPSPALAFANAPTPGERGPSFWPQVMMMQGNDGEGNGNGRQNGADSPPPEGAASKPRPRRPDPDTTMPFSTVLRRPKASEEASDGEPSGRDPLVVESAAQLIRRIQEPDLKFRESLRERDLEFRLKPPSGTELPTARIERIIPALIQYLNALSIGQAIPAGRKIVIVQEGEGAEWRRFSLIKGGAGFECHPPLPQSSGPEEVPSRPLAESPVDSPEAKPPSAPPAVAVRSEEARAESDSEPPKLSSEEETARMIPLRAHSLESLPRLLVLAARQAERRGGAGVVLVETGDIRQEDLSALEPEDLLGFSEGTQLQLLATEARRTFRGTLVEGRIHWEEREDKGWERSAIFSNVTVRSTTDIFQVLWAYSRTETSSMENELELRFRGPAPATNSLAEFVGSTLDRYPLTSRERIRIFLGEEEPALSFRRLENGRWEAE